MCYHVQDSIFIVRNVLKVKFPKYCTYTAENPREEGQDSRDKTGFSIIVELEPYMLKVFLRKNQPLLLLTTAIAGGHVAGKRTPPKRDVMSI